MTTFLLILILVLGMLSGGFLTAGYMGLKASKQNTAKRNANQELSGMMFEAGRFISGIKEKTEDTEVLSFVSMVGLWMLRFPCGKKNTEDNRRYAQFEAFQEYKHRYGGEEFPFLSSKDCMYFDAFLRFWYEGKIPPYLMIDFCTSLSENPDLGIEKIIMDIANNQGFEHLKKELESIPDSL